jgi:tRNA pseudouridine55 synthase
VGKVGHAGTLDPFADGVLLVCVGKATKRVSSLVEQEKEYVAELCLGLETDTLDVTGNIIRTAPVPEWDEAHLRSVLSSFTGSIRQTPPRYSAVKVNGQRAYHLARKGRDVELSEREIFISELELFKWDLSYISIRVTCSKGTYIRSLARDLARALDTVGYVQTLTRTRIGEYGIRESIRLPQLTREVFEERMGYRNG